MGAWAPGRARSAPLLLLVLPLLGIARLLPAEGVGLWLDPSVKGDPVYSEHWAGHRKVEVTIEPDQIVIKRSG